MSDKWAFSDVADAREVDDELLDHVGSIIDPDGEKVIEAIETSFNKAQRRGWISDEIEPDDIDVVKEMKSIQKTRETNRDIREGDANAIRARQGFSGSDNSIDLHDWEKIEVLKDLFRHEPEVSQTDFTNNVFQTIIFSNQIPPTGRGKTSTAYTLIEIAQVVLDDLQVWSNNTSDPFATVPKQWPDIVDEIESHNGPGLLLIDDGSTFLQYADRTAGKSVSEVLKLLRKHRTHFILIGHTGRDIPADIRRQVFVVNKKSEKQGEFGYGVVKGKDDRMKVDDVQFEFEVPHTSIGYEDVADHGFAITFDADTEEMSDMEEQRLMKITCNECGIQAYQYKNQDYNPILETGYCHNHQPDMTDSENNKEEDSTRARTREEDTPVEGEGVADDD